MKIICSKNDLLEGVNVVQKAVSSRTNMPILQCILLQATNQIFRLVGNDLELGIESQVAADIIESGSVSLEARMFSEIVKRLPDMAIEISVDENNTTTITCGKSEFVLSGQPGSEFIQLPTVPKDNAFVMSQWVLREMIHQTIFSIAVEEIRPVLTGELLQYQNNRLDMVSVDGYRVSMRHMQINQDMDDFKLIIPGKTLNEISKILNQDHEAFVNVYYTDKHIMFEIESSMIVSRLIEGEFPKYEAINSNSYDTLMTINRKSFIQSLERAALITKESKKNPIKLNIQEALLTITSNTEIGNVKEELDITIMGKALEIAFNPKYLIDALKAIDDESVVFQFTTPLNPCIIRQVEGDDYKYLVLPIRVNH